MKVNLDALGKHAEQVVRSIGSFADKQGVKGFLIGGSVRDLFLKRQVKDIDVVVEGDAVAFAQFFADQKGLPLKIHKQFKTAVLGEWNHICVDFVTARSETYSCPGALPVIRPATLKEDIFRRDFTINALAVSMNCQDFGTVIDLCEGGEDLKHGRIRVFHEKSFEDDPTRILRAVRFEQRFNFHFSAKTRILLKEMIAQHVERTVTLPRYFQEFSRGFFEDQPGKYILRLKALGALDFLGKDVVAEKKVLNFLDDMKKKGEGIIVQDPSVIYMSALYAGCHDSRIIQWGKTFQWTRIQKKKVLEMIQKLRKAGLKEKADAVCAVKAFQGVFRG